MRTFWSTGALLAIACSPGDQPSSGSDGLPCYITSTSDASSGEQGTLRKVLETSIPQGACGGGSVDGVSDTFVDFVGFDAAVYVDSSVTDATGGILLTETLDLAFSATVVVGNPSDDAVDDAGTTHKYADSAKQAYMTTAPVDGFYGGGRVLLDARNLPSDQGPFSCSGNGTLALRSVVVLTAGLGEAEVLNDCVDSGGDVHVCGGDTDASVEPGIAGWCTE